MVRDTFLKKSTVFVKHLLVSYKRVPAFNNLFVNQVPFECVYRLYI